MGQFFKLTAGKKSLLTKRILVRVGFSLLVCASLSILSTKSFSMDTRPLGQQTETAQQIAQRIYNEIFVGVRGSTYTLENKKRDAPMGYFFF